MHWLDSWLLDRVYQPIVDALYDRVGDCAIIARTVLTHALGLSTCLLIWYLFARERQWATIIAQIFMAYGIIAAMRGFRHHIGKVGPNPLRFFLLYPRLMVLLWGLADIVVNLMTLRDDPVGSIGEIIRNILVVSGFYFISCYNHPPMKRQRVAQREFA